MLEIPNLGVTVFRLPSSQAGVEEARTIDKGVENEPAVLLYQIVDVSEDSTTGRNKISSAVSMPSESFAM